MFRLLIETVMPDSLGLAIHFFDAGGGNEEEFTEAEKEIHEQSKTYWVTLVQSVLEGPQPAMIFCNELVNAEVDDNCQH